MCTPSLVPERLRLRLHISRLLVTFVLRDSMAEWRKTDVDRMVGLQWQMQPNQERLREVLMIEARIAAHRSRTQVSNRVALAFDAIHARHLQELPSLEENLMQLQDEDAFIQVVGIEPPIWLPPPPPMPKVAFVPVVKAQGKGKGKDNGKGRARFRTSSMNIKGKAKGGKGKSKVVNDGKGKDKGKCGALRKGKADNDKGKGKDKGKETVLSKARPEPSPCKRCPEPVRAMEKAVAPAKAVPKAKGPTPLLSPGLPPPPSTASASSSKAAPAQVNTVPGLRTKQRAGGNSGSA